MATGVIQGLAFAADLPVAPVSTLAALAQQTVPDYEGKTIYAALDARMAEVYWCEFTVQDGKLIRVSDEAVIAPDKIIVKEGHDAVGIGHGWATYIDELTCCVNAHALSVLETALPRADEVARLAIDVVLKGQTVTAENALPVYLRDNVAKKKAQQ
jgi:tRNA threonylcarbamoyladenosine biosynthesis protein TsaB